MITTRHTTPFLIALVILIPALSLAAGTSTATSTPTPEASSTATTSTPTPVTPVATTTPKVSEAGLSAEAQTRVNNLAGLISNKQDAMVRRIDNVTNRLESRLKIMETSGSDVTAARTHLNEARISLAKASSSLSTIDKAVINFVTSPNPRESWVGLKRTYTDINTNIRSAYAAIVAAVDAASSAGAAPTPATTSSTTASTSPAL